MWLCIDQGGHSTRAAVFDAHGAIVAESSNPVSTQRPAPTRVEHDPAELLRSVRQCIDGVAEQLGTDTVGLRGAALATQRSTIVCTSRAGEALTPLMSWQDRRGGDDLGHFDAAAAVIKRITGLRLSPHYGVGKLRWCLHHDPRVGEHRAHHDLIAAPLASFVAHALCREQPWVIDPVNASRTLLMDLRGATWSETLLRLFDIPPELLPTIRPNRSNHGTITVGEHDVPLTVLTGDQAAAIFAFGEPAPSTAFINIGTGAFIQMTTGTVPVADDGLLTSVVWQDDATLRYVLEGTVNGAASAIDTALRAFDVEVAPDSPELADALAGISRAPLYLNGESGLGSPDWVPDFESRFLGDGTALEHIAAVYESIAFLIQRNLDRLSQRRPVTRLRVSGGLARLDWLVQQIADLSGLAVVRPDETEATLSGLGYLVSGGEIADASSGTEIRPRPNAVASRRYRDWTRALEATLGF